jgi:hypothetical protein
MESMTHTPNAKTRLLLAIFPAQVSQYLHFKIEICSLGRLNCIQDIILTEAIFLRLIQIFSYNCI